MAKGQATDLTTLVVWLFIAVTPVIYWAVLFFVVNIQGFKPAAFDAENFRYLLIVLYAAAAISGFISHKVYVSGSGIYPSDEARRAQRFTRFIIAWALAESIAIYGLVLALIRADLVLYYPLGLASLLILIGQRPTKKPTATGRSLRSYMDGE